MSREVACVSRPHAIAFSLTECVFLSVSHQQGTHPFVLIQPSKSAILHMFQDWWNATTIGDYWRLWNMPVHKVRQCDCPAALRSMHHSQADYSTSCRICCCMRIEPGALRLCLPS